MVKYSWLNYFHKVKDLYVYRNIDIKDKYKLYGDFISNSFDISIKYQGRINLHDIVIAKDLFGYKIYFHLVKGDL